MSRCPSTGKVRYPDRLAAQIALASTARRRKSRVETRWYRCPDCHGYHLTSQPVKGHGW